MPALLFVCVLFVLFLLFVVILSGEPKQNQRRGLVDRSNFIAGNPNALLLFLFFGDFRCSGCSLLLFLLSINIEIGKIDVKC